MFDSVHIILTTVGANSEKPEKYFRLKINRIAWKIEKIGFQNNFEKFPTHSC